MSIKGFIGYTVLFIVGAALTETAITDPAIGVGGKIFGSICGLIMMALPAVVVLSEREGLLNAIKHPIDTMRRKIKILQVLTKTDAPDDGNETERKISEFKRAYNTFFANAGIRENSSIQNTATQVHWSVLTLQKRRLESRGLTVQFDAHRVKWSTDGYKNDIVDTSWFVSAPTDIPAVSSRKHFDGKYEIIDAEETVESTKTFMKGGQKIGEATTSQVLGYNFINARQTGPNQVICPNCGNVSTRENLIDGCDYCHTKFTIEDLGTRVSDFGFRPDYELNYNKYREIRSKFSLIVSLIVGIPVGIASMILSIIAAMQMEEPMGPMMTICCAILSVGFVTGAAVYFGLLFFYFIVFPIIQGVMSVAHSIKQKSDKQKSCKDSDLKFEKYMHQNDPLFSMSAFYASLHNKLSSIIYGNNATEKTAFTEGPIAQGWVSQNSGRLNDVVNMETQWQKVINHNSNGQTHTMTVETCVDLYHENNGRITSESKVMQLTLAKNALCKSQTICGPSFQKCGACGASISVLEGKICPQCGHERKISDVDWAIVDIKM